MRVPFAVALLVLVAGAGVALADPPTMNPAADRNAADWADWDAQARVTEGDYDGAVQAARQADADRARAAQLEQMARAGKRP